MKETSVNHSYIRIITYIENWMGKKMYSTHVLMLNKHLKEDLDRFVKFVQTQFPTIEFVELIENDKSN